MGWSRAQRRCFQRAMSGIEVAFAMDERVRICELTSRLGMDAKRFHRCFRALVMRIRRRFGRFEYIACKEWGDKSGMLHAHILFRGVFISQAWLSDAWAELTGAFRVYLRELNRWRKKQVGAYFVKYFSRKACSGRYWMSWGWVYRGFVRDWKFIVSAYGRDAVRVWRRLLHGEFIGGLHVPWWSQSSLGDRG